MTIEFTHPRRAEKQWQFTNYLNFQKQETSSQKEECQ